MQNVKKSAAITLWAAMAIGLAGAGAAEEGGMIPGGDEGMQQRWSIIWTATRMVFCRRLNLPRAGARRPMARR